MAVHWTVRWIAMLVLFALCTFAFSAYASAEETTESSSTVETETIESDDADSHELGNEDSADPLHNTERSAEERPTPMERTPDYMLTITRSAFLGAVLGGLVGGSIYVLTGREISPWVIGYSAAGGVFFGAIVGTMEVAAREARVRQARQRMEPFDDTPTERAVTSQRSGFSLPLLRLEF